MAGCPNGMAFQGMVWKYSAEAARTQRHTQRETQVGECTPTHHNQRASSSEGAGTMAGSARQRTKELFLAFVRRHEHNLHVQSSSLGALVPLRKSWREVTARRAPANPHPQCSQHITHESQHSSGSSDSRRNSRRNSRRKQQAEQAEQQAGQQTTCTAGSTADSTADSTRSRRNSRQHSSGTAGPRTSARRSRRTGAAATTRPRGRRCRAPW
jgi:hypothetical protein